LYAQLFCLPLKALPSMLETHMNVRTGLYVLVLLNLAMLGANLLHLLSPALANSELPILRGRGLQIVDSQGRVRASISVLPAGRSTSGEEPSETVLLRLITEQGRPTVKLQSSEPTSGLSFAGPTGTSDSYLILQTKGAVSSLKLRNEDGREQILTPQ
jgi:hypothetical protein